MKPMVIHWWKDYHWPGSCAVDEETLAVGEAGTGPRVAREASGVGEAFVNMMEVWDKVFFII